MQPIGRPKYRLTVKLDVERDADIIAWLTTLPEGEHSQEARAALRRGIRDQPMSDADRLRLLIREELTQALQGNLVSRDTQGQIADTNDSVAEAEFGPKLDRMLGGMTAKRGSPNGR